MSTPDVILKINIVNESLLFLTLFLTKLWINQAFLWKEYYDHLMIYFLSLSENVISIFIQKMTPTTYHPTHSRTLPPPDQGTRELSPISVVMFCCVLFH